MFAVSGRYLQVFAGWTDSEAMWIGACLCPRGRTGVLEILLAGGAVRYRWSGLSLPSWEEECFEQKDGYYPLWFLSRGVRKKGQRRGGVIARCLLESPFHIYSKYTTFAAVMFTMFVVLQRYTL
jgi:guanyl-specific ribonuclease Sa